MRFNGSRLGLFVNTAGTSAPTAGVEIDGSGNTDISGNLNVVGDAVLNSDATIGGNAIVMGNLGVNTSPLYRFHTKGNSGFENNGFNVNLGAFDAGGPTHAFWSSVKTALYGERLQVDGWGGTLIGSHMGLRAVAEPVSGQGNSSMFGSTIYGVWGSGDGTTGGARLNTMGVYGEATTSGDATTAYGVNGFASYAAVNCGARGVAYGGAINMGVYGLGYGGSGNANYGVFGDTWGSSGGGGSGSGTYAGYFNGDVFSTTNYYISSDLKLKENIAPISNSIKDIMRLHPSTYTFKRSSEYTYMNLPGGKNFGFIAQELEEIFPQLVSRAVHPAKMEDGKKLSEAIEYKGVNYISLIPVLVAGMQEQQAMIDAKDSKLADLEKRFNELQSQFNAIQKTMGIQQGSNVIPGNKASLQQNVPNPLSNSTMIAYYLPQGQDAAMLEVMDIQGKIIFSQKLEQQGNGQIELNTAEWAAGTYTYKLLVNGETVDAKKMLIAR